MKRTTTLLLCTLLGYVAFSQTKIQPDHSYGSFKIQGTSSLHDWEQMVTEYGITGIKNAEIIQNLVVKVTVKSIESGKSIMDDKTFEALKADKFPYITMKAKELKMVNGKLEGKGLLELAGKTKEITLTGEYSPSGNSLLVKGAIPLKMTDFGIDPPTAMFGTMTTGDAISIVYDLKLKF